MYEVANISFKNINFVSIRDERTNQIYVAPKTVCQNFGIAWNTQIKKFNANAQRWGYTKISTILPGDIQKREVAIIPDSKVRTWLCTINPAKVKKEIRESLISFQQECDQVLYNYWTKGIAVNPRSSFSITPEFQNFIGGIVRISVKEALQEFTRAISDSFVDKNTFTTFAEDCDQRIKALESQNLKRPQGVLSETNKISVEQAKSMKALVKEKGKNCKGICLIWKKFRNKFGLERYSDLPENRFQEALRWLNCLEVDFDD